MDADDETGDGTTDPSASTDSGEEGSSGGGGETGSTEDGSSSGGDSSGGSTGSEVECGATLFVNFDGVTLTSGFDDAPSDVSEALAGEFPPYDGPHDPDEVISIVAAHLAPFDVCATLHRPARGPYTMVVVTEPVSEVPVFGISPLDCGNDNPNSVGFVFPDETWDVSARAMANAISGGFGPTIGLGNQDVADDDLMCRVGCSIDVDRSFKDECLPLPTTSPRECPRHVRHCPEGEQNSYQEMLAAFGPAH